MLKFGYCLLLFCIKTAFCLGVFFAPVVLYGKKNPADTKSIPDLEYQLKYVENPTAKAKILLDLVDAYMKNDLQKAFAYNDQVLTLIPNKVVDKSIWAESYYNKAIQHFINYEVEKALVYCTKSIQVVSEKDYPLIHARAYNGMSVAYRSLGDLYKAIQYGYIGISKCPKGTDGLNLRCQLRYNLGLNYVSLNQIQKAEYLVKQNLQEPKFVISIGRQAESLNLMALIAQQKKDYKGIITYAKKGIRLRKKNGNVQDDINAYIMLHIAATNLNRDAESLRFLKIAQHLTDSIQDFVSEINIMDLYASYYEKQHKLDTALMYAQRGIKVAQENQILYFHLSILNVYQRILRELGKKEQALYFLKRYEKMEDSLNSKAVRDYSIGSLTTYKINQSQEKVNQRYQEKLKQEKNRQMAGVVILVFALLISSAVFILYFLRRRFNQQLNQQQTTILTQRDQLAQLNELKTQLFGSISAELRKPMEEIRKITLELQPGISPEHEDAILKNLGRYATFTAVSMEEQLLIARFQMLGRDALYPKEIQLNTLCKDLEKDILGLGKNPQWTLQLQIPDRLMAFSDVNVLKSLLRKLIVKSVKMAKHQPAEFVLQANLEQGMLKIQMSNPAITGRNEPTSPELEEIHLESPSTSSNWFNTSLQEWASLIDAKLVEWPGGFELTLQDQ
jgi:tetratricopeptide (TPR) repeat protein